MYFIASSPLAFAVSTRVYIPALAACKDDYFDTMGIEVIVLIFCLKSLEMAEFLTLLSKAPPLTWQKAGLEAVLFCFSGVIRGWAIVDLCDIIILLGLSLDRYKATVPRELVLSSTWANSKSRWHSL